MRRAYFSTRQRPADRLGTGEKTLTQKARRRGAKFLFLFSGAVSSARFCVQNFMNFTEIENLEERFQIATYAKMNIAVETGKGAWIWTSDGTKYLDLYGGHAVCATGHAHPHVVRAIQEQAEKVLFYSNLVYSEIRARAA